MKHGIIMHIDHDYIVFGIIASWCYLPEIIFMHMSLLKLFPK